MRERERERESRAWRRLYSSYGGLDKIRGREEKEKEKRRREEERVALTTISYPSTAGASTLANSGDNKPKYNVVGFLKQSSNPLAKQRNMSML